MPEGTPLGNEIDRLRAEVAQLKRAVEVLTQHTAVAAKCPPGQRDKCTLVSEISCKECLRDWAMEKAKTETLETHIADNKGDD